MSEKYKNDEREKWIATFNPNFSQQEWHNDIVFHPTQIKYFDFFTKTSSKKEFISPEKICGIEYAYQYNCPLYKDPNWQFHWIELLHELKRLHRVMRNFKTKEAIIEHIHKDEDSKVVMQFGDHYFTTSGQHRLCLAKLLELEEVEVTVDKYELDRFLFSRELTLEKYLPFLKQKKIITNTYERNLNSNSVILNINKTSIFLDKKLIIYLVNRYKILEKQPWRGWTNSFKKNKAQSGYLNITDENELYLLDKFILRQIKNNTKKPKLPKKPTHVYIIHKV